MSLTTDIPMSRIDARIPLSVRETIDRAAAMQGRTRTDFLIAAALEKAEQVIAEQSLVRLTLEDQPYPCRRVAVGRNGNPVGLP